MRIAVVETDSGGGLVHYAYQMCSALSADADVTMIVSSDYELVGLPHSFTVDRRLALWPHRDDRPPPRTRPGRIWRKTWRTGRRAWRSGRMVWAWVVLCRHLVRTRPDIVQFSRLSFPFEALFLSWLRRRGLILTQVCHEFESRERPTGGLASFSRRLLAGAYPNFSAIFFHGEHQREAFRASFPACPPERQHLIDHGNEQMFLDLEGRVGDPRETRARYGLGPDDRLVLFFGNLMPSKGVGDLIEAFGLVEPALRAHLVVAGYPTKMISVPDLEAARQRVADPARVHLDLRYLPMEEVPAIMRAADVAVYPYRSSTASGAIQVAYAMGVPVVATAVGGLADVVEDGGTGFLVPLGDRRAMADAIAAILREPELGARMGERAAELSRTRFAWSTVAAAVLRVYEDLLGAEGGPRAAARRRD